MAKVLLLGRSDGRAFVPDEPGRLSGWLARHKDKRVSAIYETERRPRTKKMNDRYWTLIVPAYQEYVGEEDKLQAHEDLLSLCNRADRMLPDGTLISRVLRSHDRSVEEFQAFTERAELFLAKHGVELPADPRQVGQ